jgi:hypothetical protein
MHPANTVDLAWMISPGAVERRQKDYAEWQRLKNESVLADEAKKQAPADVERRMCHGACLVSRHLMDFSLR